MEISIKNIIVPKARRLLDQAKVEEIAASIKAIGLLQPIAVRKLAGSSLIWNPDEKVELVFGEHRLAAHLKLGADTIEGIVVGMVGFEDDRAKLQEIAENLHRAELTTQQRNECLAEWVRLLEKLGVATRISDAERPISKPGRKPSPAVDAAAKMSGLSPKTVRQAIKTTKVSPAVKKAADKAELTSKQRLAISRLAGEDQQLKAVAEFAAPGTRPPTDPAKYDDVRAHRQRLDQLHAMLKAFAPLDGNPGQIAEAVRGLDVDEKTLLMIRLRRIAGFATGLADIVSGKSEPAHDRQHVAPTVSKGEKPHA
jgi:ParB/RepB/Spo0J family partition protein